MYTLLGALLGAALAATVAVVNTQRLIRKDEKLANLAQSDLRRQELTERAANLIAATYHAVLSLRDLALTEPERKPVVEKTEVRPTVDPVNRALSAIRINDPYDLVQAVEAIDRALVTLAKEANKRAFTYEEWRSYRTQIMSDKPEQAIAIARRYARSSD